APVTRWKSAACVAKRRSKVEQESSPGYHGWSVFVWGSPTSADRSAEAAAASAAARTMVLMRAVSSSLLFPLRRLGGIFFHLQQRTSRPDRTLRYQAGAGAGVFSNQRETFHMS